MLVKLSQRRSALLAFQTCGLVSSSTMVSRFFVGSPGAVAVPGHLSLQQQYNPHPEPLGWKHRRDHGSWTALQPSLVKLQPCLIAHSASAD
jgi:hypothetical protein